MSRFQSVGIGNAIVDMIGACDDAFLARTGIEKRMMQLIETERIEDLDAKMPDRRQMPGGPVAHSMAGITAFGLSTAFIGRVTDEHLSQPFLRS